MKLFKRNKVHIITIVLLWSMLIATVGQADELVGTVMSINEPARQLVVSPLKDLSSAGKKKSPVTITFPEYMIFERPGGHRLPGWAEKGNTIGVIGEYSDSSRAHFTVDTVHPDYRGANHDSTGVRGRLGRGCRRMGSGARGPEMDAPKPGSEKKKKKKSMVGNGIDDNRRGKK